MTYEERQQRIAQLSQESKTAAPARYEEIVGEIAALKEPCYQECGKKRQPGEHFPFCGAECHKAYADREYGPQSKKNRKPTVQEMQRRLKEMGQAAAQRVLSEGVMK